MEKLLASGLFTTNSKEFEIFTKTQCKLIDYNDIVNTKFQSKIKFYDYKNVVIDELLLRGHYNAKGFNIKDDIIISSFPKTGTTWLQEISSLVVNDGHFPKIDSPSFIGRTPFLEFLGAATIDDVGKMPTPRLLKTHLSYSLFVDDYSDKIYKIIYICRNPKDTVTSLYFFYKMSKLYQFSGTISEMVDLFVNDLAIYSPFAKHVLEYWEKSKTDNRILFLQYEELQMNLKNGVEKIAQFLEKNLNEHQIETITNRCTFSAMSVANAASEGDGLLGDSRISKFMRKGKVGDWKNHLSEKDNCKMDKWIEKQFGSSDLKFIYE